MRKLTVVQSEIQPIEDPFEEAGKIFAKYFLAEKEEHNSKTENTGGKHE